MSIPKENRQQMINLMYLVLTALLALNVSAEILNAFRTINNSLESSNGLLDINTKVSYTAFGAKRLKEPGNMEIPKYQERADKVMAASRSLQDYIKGLQEGIIKEAGGPGEEGTLMKRQDDLDASSRYFIEDNKKGYELKKKIEEFQAAYNTLIDTADIETVSNKLPLSTKPQKPGADWARDNFYQMPPIASLTMLTKVLSDVKSTEGLLVGYFFSKIGSSEELKPDEIVFNAFSAQITSPSAYILQGETFEANVFLAATSSKNDNVSVSVNGQGLRPDDKGIAHYKSSPGVGEYELKGNISLKNPKTNAVTSYPLPPFKYTVAAPFATVSPTKMNVFYIGVDNPVQISAAGVSASKLNVTMDNGNISGSGGNYTVRVTTQGKTNVNVSANGKSYGAFPFRIKLIPNPIAKVSGMPGGRINAAVWKAQKGVIADLENFDFDAKFEVLSFNMFYQPKLQDPGIASANGPYFSAAMQAFVSKAKPGDIFYIEEIKVKGPDGLSRKIPGIAFKID
ncbi:MAG: gliding motility protein GldM [Sphingobacteriales bacterium]|nr:gliding motility protein GldM [Sphingobacteriales bacterium]